MLETRALSRQFGGLRAVDSVDLTVEQGKIHSIIGPNGAGKTTLFNLITAALPPSKGQIFLKGNDITGFTPQQCFRAGLVRTFQITHLFPKLTARQNVSLMGRGRAMRSGSPFSRRAVSESEIAGRIDAALDRVGLSHLADEPVEILAHGDRRLVDIAMAISAMPEILLLDEPTAGMSIDETRQTAQLLASLAPQITIVIVEHDMSVVMSISDRVTVLHRGQILASGTPQEIRSSLDVQAVYFGKSGTH